MSTAPESVRLDVNVEVFGPPTGDGMLLVHDQVPTSQSYPCGPAPMDCAVVVPARAPNGATSDAITTSATKKRNLFKAIPPTSEQRRIT